MDLETLHALSAPEPEIIACADGRWLARAPRLPKKADLRIAVTAKTELGARQKFADSWVAWQRLLSACESAP